MELNWTQISRMTVQNKTQAKTDARVNDIESATAEKFQPANIGRSEFAKMENENTIRNNNFGCLSYERQC